ncbi:MAG: excinuclease ABC subunit UvrC [Kiritimatiellae bacterium]|nr:excinuclease ABC subunit UvrC [Kiritimatiellia bacterium]
MNDVLRERLKTVPNRPGCYLMRDRRGVIIYVGKAKNLRRRVLSYFRPGADHAPKVRSMVNTVADLEFMTVKNEAEALLTEANLIKKYKPHFNILMRDDKRYLALRADPAESFPAFRTCRIIRDDGACYFGPFPSAPVVRAAKDFVEKRWGLRGCNVLMPDAETHCHCHADVVRFCTAPCEGKISKEDYHARFDEACAFLRGERPQVIAELVEEMKAAAAKLDFAKAARIRDTVGALKEMTKNHFVRKRPEETRADALQGLEELAAALGLAKPPHVIECADISNLFGTHSVASLVVAVDGLPNGRYYRHFKIETVEGADDPRSMAEVVRRRYGPDSTLLATSPRADLFICDGGITQLRAARAAFAEIGVTDIPVVGLAERMEIIVTDDERGEIVLPRDSQGLFVATRLRDEAHRFAITFHRNLRERTIRESVLDEIPGIGPAKKMALLKRFHSVYGIAKAAETEIASVAGISSDLASVVKRTAQGAAGELRH